MSDPPLLSYDKPSWASPPRHQSSLTVLRQGIVLSELRCIPPDEAAQLSSLPEANGSHPLSISSSSKPITVGRLPFNRIPLDHPSVSRYHACLQFNADGDLFVYDLGSAHGTRLNNVTNPLPPRQFIPVPPGSFLQFGESSCRMIYERLDEDRTKELAEALLIEEAEERRRLASKRERSEHKDTASASDDRRRQEQQQSASTSFS
jgi:hypothetical protein